MSQRPKFWIHRTSRFWGGLLILLFLLAAWILTMTRSFHTNYGASNSGSWMRVFSSVGGGGLQLDSQHYAYTTPRSRASSSDWRSWTSDGLGVRFLPELKWTDELDVRYRERSLKVFLPFWLPLLGWTFIWPLWMHRADKKEALLFGNPDAATMPE